MRWGAVAALSLAMLSAPASRAAEQDGRLWLQRMTEALASRSYVGEFVLEGPQHAERMRIVHCVRDGVVSERLVSLSGPGRELVRNGDEVTAFLPDKRLAVIERRADRGGLLGTLPRFDADLDRWYEVRLEGRVPDLNGRPATVIVVDPRDDYRFGHRLWLDEGSAMPVRTELIDDSGRVIERLRFTRLEIHASIPDEQLQPGVDPRDFRWVRQAAEPPEAPVRWQVREPPPGFRVSASALQNMVGVPAPVSQLVLSDGLASVSVFIHATTEGREPTNGASRMGASSAFSTVIGGHEVTAIGEVPQRTLKAIVGGVVPTQDGG
ncbi:MAG: hypothetical protein AMJ58_05575 [Gammaproteobacteria bacterium SG8_30]|jgi:sigma-E factor negative regulatory protein RseB|nr:MAG: hypothetical protein AMJ58_05575 [Gammaproteobacteria bacterium SG8_30]